jgi:bifunctional DNA-binding transcriptional regulator/antitoxin component of YhaV-PrlF toxin-antitoxin module
MALIDHERFMVRLLAHVASKPNHGQRELLATIIALQSEAMVDDDTYRLVLERFGDEVADAVLNVLPKQPTDSPGDALAGQTRKAAHSSLATEHEEESWQRAASPPPASSRTRLTARAARAPVA